MTDEQKQAEAPGRAKAEALGRAKVAYLALSGVRDLLQGIKGDGADKLREKARASCSAANDLECSLRVALLSKEKKA